MEAIVYFLLGVCVGVTATVVVGYQFAQKHLTNPTTGDDDLPIEEQVVGILRNEETGNAATIKH